MGKVFTFSFRYLCMTYITRRKLNCLVLTLYGNGVIVKLYVQKKSMMQSFLNGFSWNVSLFWINFRTCMNISTVGIVSVLRYFRRQHSCKISQKTGIIFIGTRPINRLPVKLKGKVNELLLVLCISHSLAHQRNFRWCCIKRF